MKALQKSIIPIKDTGYISLDLGGAYVGYISPRDKYVDVAKNGELVGYGNIDL